MIRFRGNLTSCLWVGLILLVSMQAASCSRVSLINEKAYVVPERLKLRSSTAPASRVVGELKGGDEVTVSDRANAEDGKSWSKVNGANGESGWVETYFLVKDSIVDRSRKIAEEVKEIPAQAVGKSKAPLKLRLTADRTDDENVATLLPSGTVLEVIGRERKPRPANLPTANEGKNEVRYDEWLKVRLKGLAVVPAGWIYGGSIEMDIPGEIVYFASSGRKIVGWQKIATLKGDDSRTGDHYLVLERKLFGADEQADFDRVKVLAYDPNSRNYATPYRDEVLGRFPVFLNMEGTRGSFRLTAIRPAGGNGQPAQQDYAIEMLDGGRVKVTRAQKK
ncbi:MAG: SH3 domain-containing protein [Blastocatellia bacterium]